MLQDAYDVKPHVCDDHITIPVHWKCKRLCFNTGFQQISTRHPTKITASHWVCTECQFIETGTAIQLRQKTLSSILIIEQNLLDVHLLGSTGDLSNDFVTHPGGFCVPPQPGPKGLLAIPMIRLPLRQIRRATNLRCQCINTRLQRSIIERETICTRTLCK